MRSLIRETIQGPRRHVAGYKKVSIPAAGGGKKDDFLMGSNENEPIASGWFLTPEEITLHRGGCPREPLRPYTLDGNSVRLLVNGDQVFAELYKDLLAVKSGDFIWMTGWDIDSSVMLYPNPDEPEKADQSHIDKLLLAAIGRGVEVRMLLNSPNLSTP